MLRFRFHRGQRVSSTLPQEEFTADAVERLTKVRVRFQQDHDNFSEGEFAHLQFLLWRIRTGRLTGNTAGAS